MKKFILALAVFGSFSGIALAERPSESSDRVDYAIEATDNVQVFVQSKPLAIEESIELKNQRREDEKNDGSN